MRGWEGRKEEKLYRRRESLKIRPFPGEPLLSPLFPSPFFLPPSLPLLLHASRERSSLPFPFPSTRRATTEAEMRSDSGEILAKIPPFLLISSPFPNRSQRLEVIPIPKVYTNSASWTLLPSRRMLLSPYCRTRAPRGSPFNTPKCPIYNIVVVALPRSVAIFFSSFEDKGSLCRFDGHFVDRS